MNSPNGFEARDLFASPRLVTPIVKPDTGAMFGETQAGWTMLEWFEFLSYLVTVVGLPFAILVFIYDKRRERQNEEEELFQRLSDQYTDFLKLVLDNADLQLLRRGSSELDLTAEQKERKSALFGILVSIFERAYMLVYEENMSRQTQRLWQSWEDYMREWCARTDFREVLPALLGGEDEDFRRHILRIGCEEREKQNNRTVSSSAPGAP